MLGGMVADYAENIGQLLALSGRADWLDAKTLLTTIKFALTGTAVAATLVLAIRATWARVRR